MEKMDHNAHSVYLLYYHLVMVDVRIDGVVYKSASVDFTTGQYYWTADYSASFGE